MNRRRQKMFKRMMMLVAVVVIAILIGGVPSTASGQFNRINQSYEQVFFAQLDRDISLEQAISKYPAILDYFPIEKASPSRLVDANVPVYDISNISAHGLLSSLNARK